MLTFCWIQTYMYISEKQGVAATTCIFLFQKVVLLLPLPINGIINTPKLWLYDKVDFK